MDSSHTAHTVARPLYARVLVFLITGLALVASAGCAGHGNNIRLTRQDGTLFSQSFSQAYITQSDDGEYQIVLLDEPQLDAPTRHTAALTPAQVSPLRQVVVIHVLWRPLRGVKPDHAAATNASIDWYVTGTGSRSTSDLLHYQGAGYVRIFGRDDKVAVQVRNTTLTPTQVRGNLTDPIGPATLDGSASAAVAPQRVESILADLRDTIASSERAAGPRHAMLVHPDEQQAAPRAPLYDAPARASTGP